MFGLPCSTMCSCLCSCRYDKCQETCKQYISFLQMVLPEEEYARMLPSIHQLRSEYGLDPEVRG